MGEWEFEIRGPTWGKKKHEKQGEAILTKSTKNPEKLLIFYTNADNKTKKRNSIIGFDK